MGPSSTYPFLQLLEWPDSMGPDPIVGAASQPQPVLHVRALFFLPVSVEVNH